MRTSWLPFISALNEQPTPQYAQVVTTECSDWPSMITDFSCRVAVGHAATHAPHDTHSESMNGWFSLAATRDSKPREAMVSANVPCVSSHARTQRLQTMHFDGSYVKYGFDSSFLSFRWFAPSKPKRTWPKPVTPAMSCNSQSPLAGQVRQSSG